VIEVVVADDQALVRSGLRSLLEEQPDIRVVAEVGDGEQVVTAVRRLDPHVALVDIRMPKLDGIDATRRIVALDGPTRVIILTTFDLDEYVFAALRAGAAGFLLKDTTAEDLVAGVRTVAAGNSMLTPAITSRVIEAFAATTPVDPDVAIALDLLSPREREVLVQAARGLSNIEIAHRLHLGESTVKTHLSSVFTKLDLRDRVQAVIFAYESGLVGIGHQRD
jgi:DNA-binding NarL/FixJ family response regulator